MPKCGVTPLFAAFSTLPLTAHQPLMNTSLIGSFTGSGAIRQCKCHATCLFHLPNPGLNVKPESRRANEVIKNGGQRGGGEGWGGHNERKRAGVFISKAGAEGA